MRCYHTAGTADEEEFAQALHTAALEAHNAVKAEAATRPDEKRMATTMTLAIAVWPWLYVVQVGDSRCYHYWNGVLRQITRDQTVAQDLVDRGVLPKDRLASSPLSHVLASAIGGGEATPVLTRWDIRSGVASSSSAATASPST